MKFQKGDRVKLSPLGIERNLAAKGQVNRLGAVHHNQKSEIVSVLWDGLKTPTTYHEAFITYAEEKPS